MVAGLGTGSCSVSEVVPIKKIPEAKRSLMMLIMGDTFVCLWLTNMFVALALT